MLPQAKGLSYANVCVCMILLVTAQLDVFTTRALLSMLRMTNLMTDPSLSRIRSGAGNPR